MVEANADIEFIAEIGESDKADFLGAAAALLFPIDWPEPRAGGRRRRGDGVDALDCLSPRSFDQFQGLERVELHCRYGRGGRRCGAPGR